MHTENYIAESLELHLFFGRIMKEHSLFLKAGFTPVNSKFSAKAEFYKNEFEKLLSRAVTLSNGRMSGKVLNSGEIVTEFTLIAERQTEKLTGISINSNITKVLCCQMFTMNYPLLIEHILREAKLYRKYVQMLETDGEIDMQSMKEVECFWNQIMMEHALFIRGLLDPSETELINSADAFAADYFALLNSCHNAQNKTLTVDSMTETKKFRDFKTAGAKGIESCQIRSLILPLLADHVLREANHFIRILEN